MIKLVQLNKYYQSGNDKIHVLKDLNYVFPDTGLVFILGPSGSGKSTLLNLLGGLDNPDTGEIYIEDRPLSSFSSREKNNYLNSYLGFVFQEYNILKDLNLKENISLSLEIQGFKKKTINKKVNQIIKDVELDGLEKRKVNQLSGGQKQRIAIARALVKDPKLIIADEPTGNLDSETSTKIFNLFKTLSKDRLIIIVTHDEESALTYADDILRIETAKVENDTSTNSTISSNNTTINSEKVNASSNSVSDLEDIIDESNQNTISENLNTSSNDETVSTNKLVLKKAKTPIKTINKLAFKNVWKKKFRYLLIFFISAISLSFLSFAIELNGDKLYQNVYTTINNNIHYTDIYQYIENPNASKDDFYAKYQMSQLDNGSYDTIKNLTSELTIHKYENIIIDYTKYQSERQNFLYRGKIDTIIRYDETNTYKLLAGRRPFNDKNEILITDYLFESFKHFGLIDQNSQIYDILNRSFDFGFEESLIVVGIVETQYRNWLHLSNQTIYPVNYIVDPYDKHFQGFTYDYLMMNSIIVSDETYKIINRSNVQMSLNNSEISINQFKSIDDNQTIIGNNPTNLGDIIIPISLLKTIISLSNEQIDLLNTNISEINDENVINQYNDLLNSIIGIELAYKAVYKQNSVTEYPYVSTDQSTFKITGLTNDEFFYLSEENYSIFSYHYQHLREIKNNDETLFNISQINVNGVPLREETQIKQYESEITFAGTLPESNDEIVVPLEYIKEMFSLPDYYYNIIKRYSENRQDLLPYEITQIYRPAIATILSSNITVKINFTPKNEDNHHQTTLTKEFKVCGITSTNDFILGSRDYVKYTNLISNYCDLGSKKSENIVVELPNNPKEALNIFNKLYEDKHHFVLDVFTYKDRIESYDVDPIIEFASTGGLIVFTILTIGIMWSVISIEIVDSKKEIGIMRSIGLTGFKVSLIFLIQMFFINICAYGISIPIANFAINYYGSSLTDALGEINLTMYTMTYRTPLFLAIFVIIITTISTFLPLMKIISKKIINIINERDE